MGSSDLDRLTAEVGRVLGAHLPAGAAVAVAVSGGPDSVGLLHLVAAARPDLDLLVAHVRHGLRDDSRDVEAARANAAAVGAEWVALPVDVDAGAGPEDAARRARLTALTTLARDRGLAGVLLGHTGDDQAETLLLRIARGCGVDGLVGMRPVSDRGGVALLRPLLGLRRDDVRSVAERHPTVHDPTNDDPWQRRARARHEALPALGRLRPDDGDPVPALMRLAALAAGDVALIERLAPRPRLRRYGTAVVLLRDDDAWRDTAAGRAVAARHLRAALEALPRGPRPAPSAASVQRALDLEPGERTQVEGGVRVDRHGELLVLVGPDAPTWEPVELPLGETVTVPRTTFRVRVDAVPPTPAAPGRSDAVDVGWPDGGAVGLAMRSRRERGDRAIRKLLQAHPAPLRDQVPIVTAADGTVLLVGTAPVRAPVPGERGLRITLSAPWVPPTRYPHGP